MAITNVYKYNGKCLTNAQGQLLTAVPSSYSFNFHTNSEATVLLPNGKWLRIQSPTAFGTGEGFAVLSADFNLCIISGGYHWGSYALSESYLTQNVYIYDLPDGYSFPTPGDDGSTTANYIISKYEPVAVIKWDRGAYTIKVMTPSQAGGYY